MNVQEQKVKPLLAVRELCKGFRDPEGQWLQVVDVPAFELAAGEQVALEGVSGGGKTTFLHLMAGILAADSGSIQVEGQELVGLAEVRRDRVRAQKVGYIFQSFHLLPALTALENVELGMLFGGTPNRALSTDLLTRVGLQDRLRFPVGRLSVGQQQRVALARALANRPRLILADEPTANLDARHAGAAIELLLELCLQSGAGLLLVSHDRQVVARFPRVERLSELNRALRMSA